MSELRTRCYAFVSDQSAGEWDDKTIVNDTEKLLTFVKTEQFALVNALRTARRQLVTLGGDVRPYPKDNGDMIQCAVLQDIDAALAALSPTGEAGR